MALTSHRFSAVAGVLALGLLAACGNGAGLAGAVAGLRGNQAVDLDSVSRSKIEAFGTPILRAKVPGLGLDLLMSIRDTKGDVVTWEAAEGITFAFRNGVLIESRGLGPELMSAAVPSPGQLVSSGSYPRTYYFVSEEETNERRPYTCTPSAAGPETVTVYGKEHRTRLIREECLRDLGKITNEYWFEGKVLRQSRQWISPRAGYAEFSRVID
jgi:Group 4 capsule polysaccharide lipoprotein gfcB, YjbF